MTLRINWCQTEWVEERGERGVRGADKDVKREFLIGGFHYFPMPKAEDEDFDL